MNMCNMSEEKPRPVLVTSAKSIAVSANGKPRTKEITSRYKSPYPNCSQKSPMLKTPAHQCAQSTERRNPSTPLSSRPSTPLSSKSSKSATPVCNSMAEKLNSSRRSVIGQAPHGLWPSIRNLSASFRSESSSVLPSKNNSRPVRKSSPILANERKRNALERLENSRPVENAHVRAINQLRWHGLNSTALLTRSVDLTDKTSRSSPLPISAREFSPARSKSIKKSTTELQRPGSSKGSEKGRNVTSLPSSARPSRSPSPVPSLGRPSSPIKASISRGMASPLKTRPSTQCYSSSIASAQVGISSFVFNYIADVRKGKRNKNQIEEAHQLRLLYNRDLQWRYMNARADAAVSAQKLITESMLYNALNITSILRDSVIMKRIDAQNLRHEMKLKFTLKDQIAYLEDWSKLEAEHSSSLSGSIEALKASTLRLPLTGGATADVTAVKEAVNSAVDVVEAISSVCYLLSRVEGTDSLVSELCEVAAIESIMLDDCRVLLASTAAMQVQECSLRTHLVQSVHV